MNKFYYRELLEKAMAEADHSDNLDHREIVIETFTNSIIDEVARDDYTVEREMVLRLICTLCRRLDAKTA